MISRAERTRFGEWWWTIDKPLLFALSALMLGGIVLSLAASPAVAERLNLDLFHFVNRQVMFLLPAVFLMVGLSFLELRSVRRTALIAFTIFYPLMIATLFIGPEIKGAHRWIQIGPLGLQPSEFVKPAFIVLASWLFAEGAQRKDVPGHLMAIVLFAATIGIMILQPDFGQTMLISVVWGALFFLAGLRWIWMAGLGGLGVGGVFLAYEALPHVRTRIAKFMDPDSGENFQSERAFDSFVSGGWLGKGPGEGTVKRILPDAHTDFIFAVTGEEFGIMFCLVLLSLFAFIVLRGLWLASEEEDPFTRLAICGLTMLFGLQSAINMAVNVQLMPAKGMTLPFISYGGSSLLSLALGMGMLLSLTRRRPRAQLSRGMAPLPMGQFA
ncbi:putative lipid II flippase FtsW [Terrihabitans sp. B22-R8]|uniref:putative lipid II flippase FtsW n=1 Tax=Terrihabitans sp. B22-R8 TaxID=3425128 RepID=UPI00403CD5BC